MGGVVQGDFYYYINQSVTNEVSRSYTKGTITGPAGVWDSAGW